MKQLFISKIIFPKFCKCHYTMRSSYDINRIYFQRGKVKNLESPTLDEKQSFEGAFLNSSVKYILPTFFCNIFENFLAVTINVKNVRLESIKWRILPGDSGVHVTFEAPSSGAFYVAFSLCLMIREGIVEPSSIGIEPWDNNIVLTIALKDMEDLVEYEFGLDEGSMSKKFFSCIDSMKNKLKNLTVILDLRFF